MAKFQLADGTEIEAFTQEEVASQISGLKSKVDELLGETKTAKQKAKELEDANAAEQESRAKEKGEFKALYEKEQSDKRQLAEQFSSFQAKVQHQEIQLAATEIAGEMTRDSARAALLVEQISALSKYTDDGIVFELGGIAVAKTKVIEHISEKYPFLIDGSGASGGGAIGGRNGGGATAGKSDGTKAERVAYIAAKYKLQQG